VQAIELLPVGAYRRQPAASHQVDAGRPPSGAWGNLTVGQHHLMHPRDKLDQAFARESGKGRVLTQEVPVAQLQGVDPQDLPQRRVDAQQRQEDAPVEPEHLQWCRCAHRGRPWGLLDQCQLAESLAW